MICPICGANNEDNVMFCAQCGADLTNAQQQNYTNNYAPVQQEQPGKGMAIASLICGILGVTLCAGSGLPNILAIIFAIVAKKKGSKGGMSTAGLILGILGLVVTIAFVVFILSIYGLAFFAAFAGGSY